MKIIFTNSGVGCWGGVDFIGKDDDKFDWEKCSFHSLTCLSVCLCACLLACLPACLLSLALLPLPSVAKRVAGWLPVVDTFCTTAVAAVVAAAAATVGAFYHIVFHCVCVHTKSVARRYLLLLLVSGPREGVWVWKRAHEWIFLTWLLLLPLPLTLPPLLNRLRRTDGRQGFVDSSGTCVPMMMMMTTTASLLGYFMWLWGRRRHCYCCFCILFHITFLLSVPFSSFLLIIDVW